MRQCPLRFVPHAGGDSKPVSKSYTGDLQHATLFLDIALDLRHQVLRRFHSARIQRAAQGAGKSSGHAGDDIIQCRGIFRP